MSDPIKIGFNRDPKHLTLQAVLWIRDILVRIRIRESIPLTYRSGSVFGSGSGSDQDPAFSSVANKMPKKYFFFEVVCLLPFEDTFTSVLTDKSQKIV
jgi:hypothetical protein